MPLRDDITAATAEGIIDPDGAERLIAFLEARRRGEADRAADREEVRFVRGFHDVFLTIGIVMLFIGLGTMIVPVAGLLPTALLAAILSWALAEFFARRRRLVLPSMALAIIFVVHAGVVGMAIFGLTVISVDVLFERSFALLFGALVALVSGGAFFLRFRLPFTLAVTAAAAVVAFFSAVHLAAPGVFDADGPLLLLIGGLAVFGAAMAFDLSDPQRRTLRSDNAFWLHLLAAPLILRGVFHFVLAGGDLDAGSALIIVGTVVLFGLLAVVIDRRALLVAGLVYLGYSLSELIRAADLGGSSSAALTLTLIGGMVILLAVGWQQTRSALISVLPLPASLVSRLPVIPERP